VGVHGIVTWCINAWGIENGVEEMANFSKDNVYRVCVCVYNWYQSPTIYLGIYNNLTVIEVVVYTHKRTVVYGHLHREIMRQSCCQLMQHNRKKLCYGV